MRRSEQWEHDISPEEALPKWTEYDIPLQMKSKQRLPRKKKLNENMKIWFKQNHNKDCMRSSCMNLCKKQNDSQIFHNEIMFIYNTVENDHQSVTFSYLCLILRKISIEDKAQRS
jgi:hypothetical protein